MKAASLKELKAELSMLPKEQLLGLCLHLAKYKKENKELLSYLLFESHDEQSFTTQVKILLEEQFEGVNRDNLYLAKKTLRKILRTANKFIKYSGSKQTEVELLIYYCKKLRRFGFSLKENSALGNIYLRQIQRISKALATLHEDLQYDYSEELKLLVKY